MRIEVEQAGKRLDSYLTEHLAWMTRSMVQHLIAQGGVKTVQGKVLKKNYQVQIGDCLEVEIPEPQAIAVVAQNIPLQIVYEDEDLIVIDKERGMVVHPAPGNWDGTLVNALMFHCGEQLSGINGEIRPGIVHRIDKDTSGLLVVAKNDLAHQSLSEQIAAHTAKREYRAIVIGCPKQMQGTIDKPIARHPIDRKKMAIVQGGREAITHYTVEEIYQGYALVAFRLETGRTHQIRVHMAAIGHPIIGDPIYGRKHERFEKIGGQCLHAYRLSFCHPRTGEQMTFEAPLPNYFQDILRRLRR